MKLAHVCLPLALLIAGPAFAQPAPAHDHEHAPPAAAAAPTDVDMHARCQAMMGAKMAGPPLHDHARDKQGMAGNMKTKPPTAEEMAAMHKCCAEMMKPEVPPAKN